MQHKKDERINMLSKSQISFVNALHQKKYRKEHALFIVEGSKSIIEFANSNYVVNIVFHTSEAIEKINKLSPTIKMQELKSDELKKISTLSTPQDSLALIQLPQKTQVSPDYFKGRFVLLLDGVQDPGNLGTIIRTADWFGLKEIICSTDTVDAYNPKVVQASMGSLARMDIHYLNLEDFISSSTSTVYGAMLEGKSIYDEKFAEDGFIVLGNEGNGISPKVKRLIQNAVTIPRFGGAESLNVAISAAIICAELKRNRQ